MLLRMLTAGVSNSPVAVDSRRIHVDHHYLVPLVDRSSRPQLHWPVPPLLSGLVCSSAAHLCRMTREERAGVPAWHELPTRRLSSSFTIRRMSANLFLGDGPHVAYSALRQLREFSTRLDDKLPRHPCVLQMVTMDCA